MSASAAEASSLRRWEATDLLSTGEAGPALARGGVMRTGAFVIGSLFSVAAAALLFRRLGVADSGRYTAALSLGAVAMGVTDLGVNVIGLREFTILRGEQRAMLVRNLLGIRLTLSLLGGAIVSAIAFLVYGSLMGLAVLIASSGLIVQGFQMTLTVPLTAALRLGWMSVLELARQVVAATAIVLLVLFGAHLLAFLAVVVVASLLMLPATIALVRGDIPIRPSFDVGEWRRLIVPGLAYSAATITATLYLRVAIVFVSLTAGGRQLGYFSVSFRIVESLLVLPGLLVGSAFPLFAHAAHEDPVRLGHAVSRVFDAALIFGAWVSLSLAVGSSLAIDVVAGPSFHPAASVLAVQGLVVGAVFISSVWSYAMLSLRLHRLILAFNLSLLALLACVVAVLSSLFGAEGAAAATAAVEIIAAVAGAVVLARGRAYLWPDVRLLPKVALAACAGASPMLLSSLPVVGRVCLSSFLYVAVLSLVKGFPTGMGSLLFSSRHRRRPS